MFKINESIIVIQAEAINPIQTNVVFWSHDRGTAKLRMKLVRKNGVPQSLPEGTTVPIRLMFKSATAEGGYGKHDYLATIEDRVNGIVSIVLEDNILGYVGKVEGSVYIDFPDDRSLDTAGRFTFDIKRSSIDDSTPELEGYYFNGFSQTIDKIEKILADGKQEIDQKITESETQIDAKVKDTNDKITKANQDVATLNTNIDKANNRIDQTNQQIGDLGKLKKMYSNSIDFGNYDYSENPNLMPYITDPWVGPLLGNGHTVKDSVKRVITHTKTRTANSGDILSLGLGIPCTAEANNRYLITTLRPSTTYTLSVTMSVGSDWTGETNTIGVRLRYLNEQGGIELPINALIPANVERDKMVTHTFTGITKDNVTSITNCYVEIFSLNSEYKGTVSVSYDVKLKAHYPNLLDGPYWLGKVPLGENIADPTVVFPHKTSEYMVYGRRNTENYIADQTYTISMKATKLTVQSFAVYIAAGRVKVGDMKPTEGLANTWELTFTVTKQHIDSGVTNYLEIYQYPSATKGAVQIDWLKIEKGNTRTPNISKYKYFGEGLKDSNNPNDYSWDVTPEYTEKALTNTLNLTDPQTALGIKNFKDGARIDGVDVATVKNLGSVLQSGSGLTTIQSDKQSAFDEFSYEFERIGDRVFFHARVKTNSTTAVASHVNLLEIPLGFQFPVEWTIVGIPLSVVQWTTPQGEISALVITDLTGKQVVKFATNRVGNHYISGEWRTADSYPETK